MILAMVYSLLKMPTITPRWIDSSTGDMFSGSLIGGEVEDEDRDGPTIQFSLLTV